MVRTTFNIATQFSRYPGGRLRSDGPFSGEEFRDSVLRPLLDRDGQVEIELDGTRGYPPSFLDEVFGGLVRLGYRKDDLKSRIIFSTSDDRLKKEVLSYIDDAVGK